MNASAIGTDLDYKRDEILQRHRSLWAAVFRQGLIDAAEDFIAWSNQREQVLVGVTPRPQFSYDALRWINSDTDKHTGSFQWLCDMFDIHPERARSLWRMNIRTLGMPRRGPAKRGRNKVMAMLEQEGLI